MSDTLYEYWFGIRKDLLWIAAQVMKDEQGRPFIVVREYVNNGPMEKGRMKEILGEED